MGNDDIKKIKKILKKLLKKKQKNKRIRKRINKKRNTQALQPNNPSGFSQNMLVNRSLDNQNQIRDVVESNERLKRDLEIEKSKVAMQEDEIEVVYDKISALNNGVENGMSVINNKFNMYDRTVSGTNLYEQQFKDDLEHPTTRNAGMFNSTPTKIPKYTPNHYIYTIHDNDSSTSSSSSSEPIESISIDPKRTQSASDLYIAQMKTDIKQPSTRPIHSPAVVKPMKSSTSAVSKTIVSKPIIDYKPIVLVQKSNDDIIREHIHVHGLNVDNKYFKQGGTFKSGMLTELAKGLNIQIPEGKSRSGINTRLKELIADELKK